VFCIASGPSLTREDVQYVRGRGRVIVVNRSYELAPWADVLYAADADWWSNTPEASSFAGERWAASVGGPLERVRRVRVVSAAGLSRDPSCLVSGGHSGYQAIGFALLRGAARIVLLGYDMQCTRGLTHWHGDHPRPLQNQTNFANRIRRMRQLALDLAAAGVECINCTRETALPFFKRSTLESACHDTDKAPLQLLRTDASEAPSSRRARHPPIAAAD